MSDTHRWDKEGYLWFKHDDNRRTYGDTLFNNLTKIVEDGDTSVWAIFSFLLCTSLLISRKRWLDRDVKDDEAPNRWLWYPYKWLTKWNKRKWRRPQSDMTRDPYKAYRGCFAHLIKENDGEYDAILWYAFRSIKLPWYVWRPDWWIKWKRTIKNNRPHYVKRLDYIDGMGDKTLFDKFYANDFYHNKS